MSNSHNSFDLRIYKWQHIEPRKKFSYSWESEESTPANGFSLDFSEGCFSDYC